MNQQNKQTAMNKMRGKPVKARNPRTRTATNGIDAECPFPCALRQFNPFLLWSSVAIDQPTVNLTHRQRTGAVSHNLFVELMAQRTVSWFVDSSGSWRS